MDGIYDLNHNRYYYFLFIGEKGKTWKLIMFSEDI